MESAQTAERKNRRRTPTKTYRRRPEPSLRFTPYAWAKLLFLRDVGESEVGGFGIAHSDDLLFVEDVQLVKQECTWSDVRLLDEAVAEYFERQVENGRSLQQCGRIWIHTHPGNSAAPSGTDEATFERVFGRNHWSVMFILAQGGQTYARLQFTAGPGGSLVLPVSIDHAQPFPASEHGAWLEEYRACVVNEDMPLSVSDRREDRERPWWEEQAWFREAEGSSHEVTDAEWELWRDGWHDYEQTFQGEDF